MLGQGPGCVGEIRAGFAKVSATNSAVDNGHMFLHLVAGHGKLPLPLEELCGEVGGAVMQLDPLDHLHQGKVFVQLPNPVAAQQGLLSVKGTGDEPILCGEPDEAGVAEGVTAEKQSRDFITMELKGILTDATLQDSGLARPAKSAGGGGDYILSRLPFHHTWH